MSRLIAHFSNTTGLAINDVQSILSTAPRRYKVFHIPKRRGGYREIAQPARELKLLQRIFVEDFLADLPVHEAAKAYVVGRSIADNAQTHAGISPILKLDFRDFFPSITSTVWEKYCKDYCLFNDRMDIELSSKLLFRRKPREKTLRLSIGAPSSPLLSNLLMLEFDTEVYLKAAEKGIRYSRYADDLTFSGQRIGMLRDMIGIVEVAARQTARPRLRLNKEKTVFATARNKRTVTGLTLTNDGNVSLGREKKRLL